MLSRITSNQQSSIVIDPSTRQLRNERPDSDSIFFLVWVGRDSRRAIGFASDLQPINSSAGENQDLFLPLQLDLLGQGIIIKHAGSHLFCDSNVGEKLNFRRDWPNLWKLSGVSSSDASAKVVNLLPSLSEIRLDNDSQDLVRLSRIEPCPETAELTKALLRFCPDEDISRTVENISFGINYPAMFEAIRKHFLPRTQNLRAFYPRVDWGGPPECVSAGAHTYGDPRILYYPSAKVVFGRYCSIAEDVTIILGNHVLTGATTYPFKAEEHRWPSQLARSVQDFVPGNVDVGNDVWIGRGSIILSGARIGDGAIIGAGSVVRGTIPPYSIVIGNPGMVIRERYNTAVIERFLKLRWWDWPDWKVDRHSINMLSTDPLLFLEAGEADPS